MTLILALTTLQKLEQVPAKAWLTFGVGILGFLIVVQIIRKIIAGAKENSIVALVGFSVFLFVGVSNWVYHRTEPKFLTPIVDRLALVLPTAKSYESTQK